MWLMNDKHCHLDQNIPHSTCDYNLHGSVYWQPGSDVKNSPAKSPLTLSPGSPLQPAAPIRPCLP